jgi:pimeloyl-ACP methyl ester carboxylesterase
MRAFLLDAGFDVLAPDARGHGESGRFATYGVARADDILRWAAWIQPRAHACVYALGSSMGGAHVLMASRASRRSARSSATRRSRPSSTPDSIASGGRLGLGDAGAGSGGPAATPASAVRPLRREPAWTRDRPAIADVHVPVLLIHGEADRNTPPTTRPRWSGPASRHAVAGARRQARRPGAPTGGASPAIVAFFRDRGQIEGP